MGVKNMVFCAVYLLKINDFWAKGKFEDMDRFYAFASLYFYKMVKKIYDRGIDVG
jgi:hypothetical protein